jgi:hypothetical protein
MEYKIEDNIHSFDHESDSVTNYNVNLIVNYGLKNEKKYELNHKIVSISKLIDTVVHINLSNNSYENNIIDAKINLPNCIVGKNVKNSDIYDKKEDNNDFENKNYSREESKKVINNFNEIRIMDYIVEYMIYKNGKKGNTIPYPLNSNNLMECVDDSRDATFIDKVYNNGRGMMDLYELCHLSNYLQLNCLMHLCCAKIGSIIRGQKLSDIDDILTGKKY